MKYLKLYEDIRKKYQGDWSLGKEFEDTYYFDENNIEVGYIILHLYHKNEIYLSSFTIYDKFKNKGLGQKYLKEILNFLKKRKEKWIRLSVEYDNYSAIHIYEKLGFVKDKNMNCDVKGEFYMIKENN